MTRILPRQRRWQHDPPTARGNVLAVEGTHAIEMKAQRSADHRRQHRDSILGPLSTPHQNRSLLEVDILHAKRHRFHETQAGTVQQCRDQQRHVSQAAENGSDFRTSQHHGETRRSLRSRHVSDLADRTAKDIAVQKGQRRDRLVLGRCADVTDDSQRGNEGPNVSLAERVRVTHPVVADIPADPPDVGFLGAATVMPRPQLASYLCQQSRRRSQSARIVVRGIGRSLGHGGQCPGERPPPSPILRPRVLSNAARLPGEVEAIRELPRSRTFCHPGNSAG